MPNHIHLLLVPADADALGRPLGETHHRHTRAVNQRQGWVGHLWQGRFSSCALGPDHVLAAARYIELNPVRARLVARPEDWPWSSARAHLARCADWLMAATTPLLDEAGDWATFLASGLDDPRSMPFVAKSGRVGRSGARRSWPISISVPAGSSGRHGAAAS
jgi:putative transposase